MAKYLTMSGCVMLNAVIKLMKSEHNSQGEALINELDLLVSLIMKIRMDMDLQSFLDEIIFTLREKVSFDGCNIALIGDDGLMRIHRIDLGKISKKSKLTEEKLNKLYSKAWNREIENDLASIVARERREIHYPVVDVQSLPDEHKEFVEMYGIIGLYYLPLIVGERVFGVIRFHNYSSEMRLTDFEKELIRRRAMVIAKALESFALFDELRKKNRVIKTDLETAQRLQHNLLPQSSPMIRGVDIAMRYIPMAEVGGDFYDFIYSPEKMGRRFGFIITDASGHGVPAAFISSMLKMSVQNKEMYAASSSPSRVLSIMNESLLNKISDYFVTGCYAWFDLERMKVRFSCAGHVPVFKLNRSSGVIAEIKPKGKMLGLIDYPQFEQIELSLNVNDRFVFYTDGLTEAVNQSGIAFEERLKKLLKQESYSNASEAMYSIISELKEYALSATKKSFDDDVAVVIVDINEN